MLYTIFVFLQLFNQINARKLNNEINIFEGFFSNWIAVAVLFTEIALQVLITEFTGRVFSVNFKGLTWQQWLISIAFCTGSWVVRFFLTFIDFSKLPQVGNKESKDPRRSIRGGSRLISERHSGIRGSLTNENKQ